MPIIPLNHPLLGVVYSGLTTGNEKKNLWEKRSRIAFSYYVQSQGRLIYTLPQTNRIVQRLGAVHSFHSLVSIHDCLLVLCSIRLLRDAIESPQSLYPSNNVFASGQQKLNKPKIHVFMFRQQKLSNPRSTCLRSDNKNEATQVSKTPHWFRVLSHVGGGKPKGKQLTPPKTPPLVQGFYHMWEKAKQTQVYPPNSSLVQGFYHMRGKLSNPSLLVQGFITCGIF